MKKSELKQIIREEVERISEDISKSKTNKALKNFGFTHIKAATSEFGHDNLKTIDRRLGFRGSGTGPMTSTSVGLEYDHDNTEELIKFLEKEFKGDVIISNENSRKNTFTAKFYMGKKMLVYDFYWEWYPEYTSNVDLDPTYATHWLVFNRYEETNKNK